VATEFRCKCGAEVGVGHAIGDKIFCDECWTLRQQQESVNYPSWSGNNARKGQE